MVLESIKSHQTLLEVAVLGYGKGSMITPTLMMTNSHVLNSASRSVSAVVEFNYQLGLDGSNNPYFDFSNFGEAIRSDYGKSETDKFESNAGKVAVARATVYLLLRYPDEINSTASQYTPDRIQTIFQWHHEHPVSEHERHRNEADLCHAGEPQSFG